MWEQMFAQFMRKQKKKVNFKKKYQEKTNYEKETICSVAPTVTWTCRLLSCLVMYFLLPFLPLTLFLHCMSPLISSLFCMSPLIIHFWRSLRRIAILHPSLALLKILMWFLSFSSFQDISRNCLDRTVFIISFPFLYIINFLSFLHVVINYFLFCMLSLNYFLFCTSSFILFLPSPFPSSPPHRH